MLDIIKSSVGTKKRFGVFIDRKYAGGNPGTFNKKFTLAVLYFDDNGLIHGRHLPSLVVEDLRVRVSRPHL